MVCSKIALVADKFQFQSPRSDSYALQLFHTWNDTKESNGGKQELYMKTRILSGKIFKC